MCNPRRVEVTATLQVRESWEREVRRIAQASGLLSGEARIRRPLDDSVGGPALMALQSLLANGAPGWDEQADGSYRHAVEGGYVLYQPDGNWLEIVATASERIHAQGEAAEHLSGNIDETLQATAQGRYYDDEWGGHTEARAREEAQHAADAALQTTLQQRRTDLGDAAEQAHDAALRARAQQAAEARMAAQSEQRRPELAARAQQELENVGIRARRVFHRLLAEAYRDALTGMARRRGVANQDMQVSETDEYLEIEFRLPD